MVKDTGRIIEKIRKVLELSKNNPSEEEAKAAALKAQQMLAEYHISLADVEAVEQDVENIEEAHVSVGAGKKWKYTLARIIARNFRCRHFYYGRKMVAFYGYKTDAEVAAATFEYLFKVGHSKADSYTTSYRLKTGGTTKGFYNSFVKGFCDGIESVLERQCTALMLVVPEEVNTAYTEMSTGFSSIRHMAIQTTDVDAWENGKSAGVTAANSRAIA